MIARQEIDKKSQLEECKTDVLNKLTSKIVPIYKAHNIIIEVQNEEIENQQKQFQFKIQILEKRIQELEIEKERSE